MKRRSFVKSSLLAGAIGAALPEIVMASENLKNKSGEFYELRTYILKNESQQKLVEDYFKNAAIPAYNKAGIKNIGVFTEMNPTGQSKLFVLIPFNSIEDFYSIPEKLWLDADYLANGAAYLNAPASEPAFERIESSLLSSFKHFPKLQVPESKARIFELRRYEHATESAGKKKLEMFNDAGEVDIFKRLGFNPVFFGETIIGELRPNLIYMITFDDLDSKGSHWKAFGGDPEWKKISAIPDYADSKLVSRITSTMLKPSTFSQI